MNFITFLSALATTLPNSNTMDEMIKRQPLHIQNLIKSIDSDSLKKSISDNKFYANETKVTEY